MWTPATRRHHSREGLRYETDLTDAEWALIAPMMPEAAMTGRPRKWSLREILNAIFYVMRGGIGLRPDAWCGRQRSRGGTSSCAKWSGPRRQLLWHLR